MDISGRSIQSVEVSGRLLSALADSIAPMMLRDLALAAQMPTGQAHAYLVSFRKLRLVEQDALGRYKLGPFSQDLGLTRLRYAEPYQVASEAVVSLARDLDLPVAITLWAAAGPTTVRVQEASHQFHVNVRPGSVFRLTITATGKLFAAFMPQRLVGPIIKAELRKRRRTEGDKDAVFAHFTRELAQIRGLGISCTIGRPTPGINALSAPVFDHSGEFQLGITVMGPAMVVDGSPDGLQATTLRRFAGRLSARLGYRAPSGIAD
jgi:DNA-binding IclR family transcriptional regulator